MAVAGINIVTENIGTVSSVSGLSVLETGDKYKHTTTFSFVDVEIPVTHAAGTDGYGTLAIYTIGAGVCGSITREGSALVLSSVTGDGANISDTASFDLGIGWGTQTAANGGALDTDCDEILRNDGGGVTITLSGGSASNVTEELGLVSGAKGTAVTFYINVAGVETTDDGTITINGTFRYHWASL